MNNARNCLRIFLRSAGVRELWCPYQICNVVFRAARLEGVHLKFYHIDENFYPKQEFKKNDYILYPNYFGVCDFQARYLAEIYPNLIYDAAHSLFSEPLGVATIYSLRKFLQVSDGGVLISNTPILLSDFPVEDDFEQFSTKSNKFEYEKFLKNELRFEHSTEIKLVSLKTKRIINSIDYATEQRLRFENFNKFHTKYVKYNEIKFLQTPISPMVYPLKTKNNNIIENLVNNSNILYLRYNYIKDILPIPLN